MTTEHDTCMHTECVTERDLPRALDLLERHQWDDRIYKGRGGDGEWWLRACSTCGGEIDDGHKTDCELAQLLTENGREVRYVE